MWTICWTGAVNDDGETNDGWDRWDDYEDVLNHANTLVRELDVGDDKTIYITYRGNPDNVLMWCTQELWDKIFGK